MVVYSLYEMTGLLKMGLWQGGEVEKLGYIGTASICSYSAPDCGLSGYYVSYDTMLERCESSAQGNGCELLISQYQPYAGTYTTYQLKSNVANRELFLSELADIVIDKRNPYVWSHNIYKRNAFAIERRYTANNNSMRSGRIEVPRQSKIFGR